MATTTKPIDAAQPYDPTEPCPTCRQAIHVYLPPERMVSGPQAYPALLLHFEKAHPNVAPPPPPDQAHGPKDGDKFTDQWDPAPPTPADWRPMDPIRANRQLPQPSGVWPPVRTAEVPI